MTGKTREISSAAKLIDIDQIHILNPRTRNQKTFRDIAANMAAVGLKRPIMVTRSRSGATSKEYDLVCGQGRLEAFQASGQSQIWALVIETDETEALIMSLVENLARRKHRPLELLKAIEQLRDDGYGCVEIARKTGLPSQHVSDVLTLMRRGEERLLVAVEEGKVPTRIAATIAQAPEEEQEALHEAYESGQLRGYKLIAAKKILDQRRAYGPKIERRPAGKSSRMTGSDVVKAFEDEMGRKRLLLQKADAVSSKLIFITESLRTLLNDENFTTLLRAESLITIPRELAARIQRRHSHA